VSVLRKVSLNDANDVLSSHRLVLIATAPESSCCRNSMTRLSLHDDSFSSLNPPEPPSPGLSLFWGQRGWELLTQVFV